MKIRTPYFECGYGAGDYLAEALTPLGLDHVSTTGRRSPGSGRLVPAGPVPAAVKVPCGSPAPRDKRGRRVAPGRLR